MVFDDFRSVRSTPLPEGMRRLAIVIWLVSGWAILPPTNSLGWDDQGLVALRIASYLVTFALAGFGVRLVARWILWTLAGFREAKREGFRRVTKAAPVLLATLFGVACFHQFQTQSSDTATILASVLFGIAAGVPAWAISRLVTAIAWWVMIGFLQQRTA